MKHSRYAGTAAVAIALLSGAALATATSTLSLDTILVPAVHPNDTLRYTDVERLSGTIKHTHSETISYHILSTNDGALSFERDIPGKGTITIQRDAAGNVVTPVGRRAVLFFFSRELLGDPPNPLAVGQTWQVKIPTNSALGSPGTANVTVASVDPRSGHVVIRASMRGEGESEDMTPGDNTPTHFRTVTNRRATAELTNGILDSFVISGDDRQSANGSTPITVHVEMDVRRSR